MADPTREEIDAKLLASENLTEAKFARLQGHIDVEFKGLSAKLDAIDKKMDSEREIIETKIGGQTKYLVLSLLGAVAIAAVSAILFFVTIGQFFLQSYEAGIAAGTATMAPAQIERSKDDDAQGSTPERQN